jgi:hypothetical protein
MASADFSLELLINPPDFQGERTYVITEKEYVRKQLALMRGKWWAAMSIPSFDKVGRREWTNYVTELDKYAHELAKLEHEINEGLSPICLNVINDSDDEDFDIRITVKIKDGTIYKDKKAPERPKRIDGAPNKPSPTAFHGFQGFVRRHQRIDGTGLQAEFSSLEGGGSALMINQTLYIRCHADTRLDYEVTSRNLDESAQGYIPFALEKSGTKAPQ